MVTKAGSYRLFKLFGIEVFVHWSWFVAAYILYQMSGGGNPAVFICLYASLFGIVLMHEFGHSLACRSVGGQADTIVLWPLGGVAYVAPPAKPGAVLWSIAAGPLVNVVLAPILFGAYFLMTGSLMDRPSGPLESYVYTLASINLMLLVFNMLPIYPLDGGQILQSILWFFIGRAKSLRVTSIIGLVAAGLAFLWALSVGDWWIVLISVFVAMEAWKGYQIAKVMSMQEAHQNQSIDRAMQRAREMTVNRDR